MSLFKMSPLRILIKVVILAPVYLFMRWPQSFWLSFLMAVPFVAVAWAAAWGVEALIERTKKPAKVRAAEPTPADRRWELKMLLKKALTAEGREQWDRATALFEKVIEKADEQDDLDLAVRRIEEIRNKQSALGRA
jgi:hypothetical protein